MSKIDFIIAVLVGVCMGCVWFFILRMGCL